MSGAISSDSDGPQPTLMREAVTHEAGTLEAGFTRQIHPEGDTNETGNGGPAGISVPRAVRRMGGTIIKDMHLSQEKSPQDNSAKDRETDNSNDER